MGSGKKKKIVLSAFGIHVGGGAVLLDGLVSSVGNDSRELLLDSRFRPQATIDGIERVSFAQPTVLNRFRRFWSLSRRCGPEDILLCFNSLPPVVRVKSKVITYVHAPHLFGMDRGKYGVKTRLRLIFERLWLKCFIKNTDEIWVQTQSVQRAGKLLFPNAVIKVKPFLDHTLEPEMKKRESEGSKINSRVFSFFYPADGVGHKNHIALLGAWEILFLRGLSPTLMLTLSDSEYDRLVNESGILTAKNLSIKNFGQIDRSDVLGTLSDSSALIFPSLAETLGIPLLEATALGVPIVSSELDYVRDIVCPAATFDPHSPVSIADAVQRFMGFERALDARFFSAREFVEEILSINEEV